MTNTELNGLSDQEAKKLLSQNGPNEIPQKKNSFILKFLKSLFSPISLMLFAASGLSFFTGKLFDAHFILILLFSNLIITNLQEKKADNAIKKLNDNISTTVKVLRDNIYKKNSAKELVVGDIVKLSMGEIIPADGEILDSDNVTINESSLTGESLPKEKKVKDKVFSGSYIETGILTIKITATGKNTYFGKTIISVEKNKKKSLLEKDIINVTKFLSIISIIAIIIISTVLLVQKEPITEVLTLSLTLLIAGIPISLPTVMTLIIEVGVINLVKKNVIVRRLSALEDLSNVDYLLTDKTGTLTKNSILVKKIIPFNNFTEKESLTYSYLISNNDSENVISQAIIKKAQKEKINFSNFTVKKITPFNLEKKCSSAILVEDKKELLVTLGAPQVIEKLCNLTEKEKNNFDENLEELAKHGDRSVALSIEKNKKTELVCLFGLADELRSESPSIISFLKNKGIETTIVTGDNKEISEEIVKKTNLDEKVITKSELAKIGFDKINKETFLSTGAFAEILPDDKYQLVKQAKKYFVVASNGDGINDLPAVKEANVGFAVKNAVDALKSSADIVLLSDGINIIKKAIVEARKIFSRIYTYSIYRISESERLIVTVVILGLWFKTYPLTPLQIIILALLNDIPIISLAFDKVKSTSKPATIKVKQRFWLSSLYGLAGIMNSMIIFFIMTKVLHLNWEMIQTIFFLKLTVSGHLLIYVAHTKERWWKYLPSKQIIFATSITQIIATILAFTGFLMPTNLNIKWIIFIWLWAFFWMQVSEFMKMIQQKFNH